MQKRWKIETHARLDSILHLNSVNLPGGELRRRSDEDERAMREYLAEGDLISAEVKKDRPNINDCINIQRFYSYQDLIQMKI